MLRLDIIAVGKLREPFHVEAQKEWTKRLLTYHKVTILEVQDNRAPAAPSKREIEKIQYEEFQRVLQVAPEQAVWVALDVGGNHWSSERLAHALVTWPLEGHSKIVFLIGGSYGLHPDLLRRCSVKLALSAMTYTHQTARLMLLEQIYRGSRINSKHTYAK